MRNLTVTLNLPIDPADIQAQFDQATDPINQSLWHIFLLLIEGHTPQEIIATTGYATIWVYEIARRYETVKKYHEGVISCYRFRLTTDGKERIIAC
jgi:hypothetical protein